MKTIKLFALFGALFGSYVSQTSHAQCVETNLAQNSGNAVSGHSNAGQSFTASCTGSIVSVTIVFNNDPSGGSNANDRVINIRDGALCTSPLLYSQSIPLASLVNGVNVITLTTPVPINSGEVNSWEYTDATQSGDAGYGVSHNSGGAYPGGAAYFSCSVLAAFDLTFEVEISNAMVVDLGIDTTICPEDSLVLDAGSGAASYLWNTGESTQTIVADTAGNYIVTVVDMIGNTILDSLLMTIHAVVPVDLGMDRNLCAGDTVCMDAGTSGVSYLWNTAEITAIICPNTAGTYSVICTDNNGCEVMDTLVVSDLVPEAIIAAPNTSNCPTIGFTDGSTAAFSWLWTFGDGNSSGMQNPSNSYTTSGVFTVKLVATNECGVDSTTTDVSIFCFVGLEETLNWDVVVYPNPSSGSFQLTINGLDSPTISLQLYSITGELVLDKIIESTSSTHVENFELNELSKGEYILKLNANGSDLLERVIIIKE